MNPMPFVMLWIFAIATQIVAGGIALVRAHREDDSDPAVIVSAIASLVLCLELVLFVRVFVIGGSSNVAQFAGAEGHGLWREWFKAWPLFMCGSPLALLVTFAAALFPPYPARHPASTTSRVCGVIAALCACLVTLSAPPDA